MSFEEFQASLANACVPEGLGAPLLALWCDAKGDWDAAHRAVQDDGSQEAAWIHAYLHRKEGDMGNAGYWYQRADRPRCDTSLAEEWATLARMFTEG